VSILLTLAVLTVSAHADRPTDGTGLFAFDSADELSYVDGPEGRVRVHFSVSGPNETRLADSDADGLPDFPVLVAETAEAVLDFYEESGFRVPLRESDLGLPPLGGSDAFDFYLVDFGGSADGNFALDACVGSVCSGHMIMENDFAGYGYPSLSVATSILTSHELFHAVQAAYNAGQPSWMSEGTAMWAEWMFDPGVRDFLYVADAYLEDAGRSIDRPPAGVATAFTYGTGLFFGFLSEALDPGTAVDLQEEMEGRTEEEAVDAIAAVIEGWGETLPDTWTRFVEWNLGTGDRGGGIESYSFASSLDGPVFEAVTDGPMVEDDNRFYPLAATYYRFVHEGGELSFATPDDPSGIRFALYPVTDGSEDGPLDPAVARWAPTEAGEVGLGDLPPGGYVLLGTYPEPAAQSQKIELCLGPADAVQACLSDAAPSDTGVPGGEQPGAGGDGEKEGGCSVVGTHTAPVGGLAIVLISVLRRRRTAIA